MADKDKGKGKDKKPAPKGFGEDLDVASWLIILLIALAVISSIVAYLERYVGGINEGTSVGELVGSFLRASGLSLWIERIREPFILVSVVVSAVFAVGAVYSYIKFEQISKTRREQLKLFEAKLVEESLSGKNERWEHVEAMANSEMPGNWRVAILEADVMLDELLVGMSYDGDSVGDKLKQVEEGDLKTLDFAWEAHKVRNNIAHHGSDFILTHRETLRVIDLYRQVFKEVAYI